MREPPLYNSAAASCQLLRGFASQALQTAGRCVMFRGSLTGTPVQGKEHGTRFGTIDILVKEPQCATQRLHAHPRLHLRTCHLNIQRQRPVGPDHRGRAVVFGAPCACGRRPRHLTGEQRPRCGGVSCP